MDRKLICIGSVGLTLADGRKGGGQMPAQTSRRQGYNEAYYVLLEINDSTAMRIGFLQNTLYQLEYQTFMKMRESITSGIDILNTS